MTFSDIILNVMKFAAHIYPNNIWIHVMPNSGTTLWGYIQELSRLTGLLNPSIRLGSTFTGEPFDRLRNLIYELLMEILFMHSM